MFRLRPLPATKLLFVVAGFASAAICALRSTPPGSILVRSPPAGTCEVPMRARLSFTTIALLLGAAISYSPTASAQSSQQDSVAEAARRAREQKKAAARPAPVITDDTFKPAPAKPEVQTTSEDAPATDPPPPVGRAHSQLAAASKRLDAAQQAARKKAELAALKQQVEDKQKEVDIAK